MSSSQLFRTSLNGYNKEDVNNYIIALNNELSAQSAGLNELSEDLHRIKERSADETSQLKAKLENAETRILALSSVEEENLRLKEKVALLSSEKEEAEKKLSEMAAADSDNSVYENLCAKAGEVLVIASTTADSILKKANDEAGRIINDATDKKESLFKNISETASCAADGLSDYIKNAVDECIGKINSSIRRVEVLKNTPDEKLPLFKHER